MVDDLWRRQEKLTSTTRVAFVGFPAVLPWSWTWCVNTVNDAARHQQKSR